MKNYCGKYFFGKYTQEKEKMHKLDLKSNQKNGFLIMVTDVLEMNADMLVAIDAYNNIRSSSDNFP